MNAVGIERARRTFDRRVTTGPLGEARPLATNHLLLVLAALAELTGCGAEPPPSTLHRATLPSTLASASSAPAVLAPSPPPESDGARLDRLAESPSARLELGQELYAQGRPDEAQAAFRSLVCADRYPLSRDAEGRFATPPLPQDATTEHWRQWRERYTDRSKLKRTDPAVVFVDPFPESCRPLRPDVDDESLEEAFYRIGVWELEQKDPAGGAAPGEPIAVWSLHRAASAFRGAKRHPSALADAVRFALWDTLQEQQRYRASNAAAFEALDALRGRGNGPTIEALRSSTFAAIATNLLEPPSPEEEWTPAIGSPSVLDISNARELGRALDRAFARVDDDAQVPARFGDEVMLALLEPSLQLGRAEQGADRVLRRIDADPSSEFANRALPLVFKQYEAAEMRFRAGTAEAQRIHVKKEAVRARLVPTPTSAVPTTSMPMPLPGPTHPRLPMLGIVPATRMGELSNEPSQCRVGTICLSDLTIPRTAEPSPSTRESIPPLRAHAEHCMSLVPPSTWPRLLRVKLGIAPNGEPSGHSEITSDDPIPPEIVSCLQSAIAILPSVSPPVGGSATPDLFLLPPR